MRLCYTPSGCLLGPNAGGVRYLNGVGVLASVSLPAGVFIVTPVILLFRGLIGVVGLTWGVVSVFGAAL